jgi:hypothetical protein
MSATTHEDVSAGGESELDGQVNEILRLILTGSGRAEGREQCFSLLTKNRKLARVRLALARSYYLDGYWEFSLRELSELRRYSAAPALERLIEAMEKATGLRSGAGAANPAEEESGGDDIGVVAELDIDADLADALEEFDEQDK